MDIHSGCNEQHEHCYRRLLKNSENIFFPQSVMDSAPLLGAAESMKRQPIFLLQPISCLTNWWLYLSDPLPSFCFVMPSALWFFFIIGQMGEFSNGSCRETTSRAFILVFVSVFHIQWRGLLFTSICQALLWWMQMLSKDLPGKLQLLIRLSTLYSSVV